MEHPKPSITADIIIYDRRAQAVGLIQRGGAPFKGAWAITGGFFDPLSDASIEAAARRELKEETCLDLDVIDYHAFGFSHVRDEINRDPRGRVVSFVYFLILDYVPSTLQPKDDAKAFRWFSLKDIIEHRIELAFDHQRALDHFFPV